MRRVSDWRSDKTASEFLSHDRADLAQEFLCRNSSYEREYHEADRLTDVRFTRTHRIAGSIGASLGSKHPLLARFIAFVASGALGF